MALAPTVWGLAATGAALASLAFARGRRLLMATDVLFGFCWAIPMRHSVFFQFHTYETLIYVWLALALFSAALLGVRRLLGERAAIAAAALAALIFALSVHSRIRRTRRALRRIRPVSERRYAVLPKSALRRGCRSRALLPKRPPGRCR